MKTIFVFIFVRRGASVRETLALADRAQARLDKPSPPPRDPPFWTYFVDNPRPRSASSSL